MLSTGLDWVQQASLRKSLFFLLPLFLCDRNCVTTRSCFNKCIGVPRVFVLVRGFIFLYAFGLSGQLLVFQLVCFMVIVLFIVLRYVILVIPFKNFVAYHHTCAFTSDAFDTFLIVTTHTKIQS